MTGLTKLTLPMPRLGETMEEGTLVRWLVEPGQDFKRGDPLLEVETDKTVVEYPALGSGTLLEASADVGDVVEVGGPIAVIETADAWDGIEARDTASAEREPEVVADKTAPGTPKHNTDRSSSQRLRATPLARRIAREEGIDLATVDGTGRRGRIEARDVQAFGLGAATGMGGPSGARATKDRLVVGHRQSIRTAPVFCVHGFAGLGSNWAALRADLQRAGVKGVAPDLPGHGRNPQEVADVATLVDWLSAELAEQTVPVRLVGHSLGAHVAALAALRDPARVASLTLIAPAGCGLEINGAFITGMASAPMPGELAHLVRLLGPTAARLDAEALATMVQHLKGQRLALLGETVARDNVQRIDTLAPLRVLAGKLPVTAIFGLSDRIIPREHAFNLPAQVACHMVEAGHMPHWDATEEVAAIIAAN